MRISKFFIAVCLFIAMVIGILLSGCAMPTVAKSNREARLAEIGEEQLDNGREMIYATGVALSKEENPSKPVQVAKVLNQDAVATLGQPGMEQQKDLQKMVDNLISENEKLRSKGEKELEKREKEIVKNQDKIASLEEKISDLNAKNAAMADKQAEADKNWWNPFYDFKKGFMKVVWGGLFLILLLIGGSIASIFFPVIRPIMDGIAGVMGLATKATLKGAEAAGGLATKGVTQIATALEEWKASAKAKGIDTSSLSTTLRGTLDTDIKGLIADIKKAEGLL